jgi:hypothetical protein
MPVAFLLLHPRTTKNAGNFYTNQRKPLSTDSVSYDACLYCRSRAVFLDPEKTLRKALGVYSVPAWAVYKRKSPADVWTLVDTAPAFEIARVNQAVGKPLFK